MRHRDRDAEALIDLANVDPAGALAAADALLERLEPGATRSRAIAQRARSIAEKLLGRYENADRAAREAAAIAREAGDTEEEVLAWLALAAPLSITGKTTEAVEVIRDAAQLTDDHYLQARARFQRAHIHMLSGELGEARSGFSAALPEFRKAEDAYMVRGTLTNLGYLDIQAGQLEPAREELEEALQIAEARHERVMISGIRHNLGLLASYRGDLVGALEHLAVSERIYMDITGASAPQHVARAEVLISAGLFREALALSSRVASASREKQDVEHQANALLVAAAAALLAGEYEIAIGHADSVAQSLSGDGSRAMDARRISIEARFEVGGATQDLMKEADETASALEMGGLLLPGVEARMVASRLALGLDERAKARSWLGMLASRRDGPLEMRVDAHLARALLRLDNDDRRGASAAIRSGLGLLDRYQSAIGATDLRMGIERRGRELASMGLGLALDSGRARRILSWLERTRARALLHRPVSPTGEGELDELLARLRQVEAEMRRGEHEGDSELARRRRRLQDEIAAVTRLQRGVGNRAERFSVDQLIDRVGEDTLLEFGVHEDELFALRVEGGRVRRFDLGPFHQLQRELSHVRFGMRRSALRGLPVDTGFVSNLERLLLKGMPAPRGRVIVVPPAQLMALPWAALPGLRGLPMVVSPSAELWWRSQKRRGPSGQATLIAGGPDLVNAGDEVAQLGVLYQGAILLAPGAGVGDVLEPLPNVDLAHIACHASFSIDNPMFSSLRLGDGDLNVYDIERLDSPPRVVVLSACDSGYTEARVGDELTGMTSALLSMGTRTVVASVGLVPDSPFTVDLMVDLHRGLIAGLEPAEALARAQAGAFEDPARFVSAASFICVGA